jgi:hypothetical protein
LSFQSRVTRLGEFSPIGRLLTLGCTYVHSFLPASPVPMEWLNLEGIGDKKKQQHMYIVRNLWATFKSNSCD